MWSTATTGAPNVDVDAARRDEDRPVAERAADAREVAALPADLVVGAPAAGEDDELVARCRGSPRDALQQLRAERLDVDDEHADHVRAAAAQALRDEARLVAELLDHGAHALAEVSSATPQRSLITFDTVATETPASAATSPIVTLRSSVTARY